MEPFILLVDDDATALSETRKLIEHHIPARVIPADNADAVTASIKKYAPYFSLFILDIEMTGQSCTGIDIAQRIRQTSGCEHSPIIFLTSHKHFGGSALKQLHYYDFIHKPVDAAVLLQSIQQALAIDSATSTDIAMIQFDDLQTHHQIKTNNILCIELVQNNLIITDCLGYDFIYQVRSKTFHSICDQISHVQTPLAQVHRSYIVNLHRIKEIVFGKNTALLSLFNSDKQIPVGKTFLNILSVYNK